ncbi:adenosine receptor A1-like [Engraulis encrasicolus]|uniref:adenosine receptor A1-like n=1 Tax=Engraulis encrasicolus TaxID=184585 RepID=UPI002FD08305
MKRLTTVNLRFLRSCPCCIVFLHRYKTTVTQRRSWSVVGVSWLSAGVLGFIPMIGWYRQDTIAGMATSNSTTITCTFIAVIPMNYLVYFNFFICQLPPLVLMVVLYLCIFKRIQRQLNRSGASRGSESQNYYQKERTLGRSLLLVLVLFAICWLPIHVINVASLYGVNVPHQVFYVGILLSHANSAINPVVYGMKIHKIKSFFKMVWQRHVLCRRDQGADRRSTTRSRSRQTTENVDSAVTRNQQTSSL